MLAEQLTLFDHAHWLACGQYLAAITDALIRTKHLLEPEYSCKQLGWPTLRAWLSHAKPIHCQDGMPVGAFLQTRRCEHVARSFRYVLVSTEGYVVGESEWAHTEGGARGWLGRNTKPWEGSTDANA